VVTITGGRNLAAALKRLKDLPEKGYVKVGFLENARYPDGTPVAMVAAIQNFGAPSRGIPPRPFFSDAIAQHSPQWGERFAAVLKSADYDVETALGRMGLGIAGQVQESIDETFMPSLSKVTLMLRKMRREDPDLVVTAKVVGQAADRVKNGESVEGVSTKPLVDTGHLLASVGSEVVMGEAPPEKNI
jgi:hypothetical protein